jgi:hypothetical protein
MYARDMEVLTMIGIGIDTHKATLAVSAVDELGRELDRTTVRNDRPGHAALARWVVRLGSERRVGIEGSGGFGAALAQALLTAGESVFEVPPDPHGSRTPPPSQPRQERPGRCHRDRPCGGAGRHTSDRAGMDIERRPPPHRDGSG